VIVTPEKAVYEGAADMVVLPMFDGELGVLPGRAALIGRLGAGELRLKGPTTTTRFFVESGFAQVRSNVVTVLTSGARPAETVTGEMAATAATAADALPSGTPVERASKTRARDRASGLKKVADKNAATR
jgi:F-type H+-transporting ATPase subunit epsilon